MTKRWQDFPPADYQGSLLWCLAKISEFYATTDGQRPGIPPQTTTQMGVYQCGVPFRITGNRLVANVIAGMKKTACHSALQQRSE
ncbi:hypothetical protein [Erwinia psidii]|uniref:Uncharacterized protein n=1 Tax=Erwinia psidii TaxID=69224 RepID=A0A3N6S1H2_9GAMM|nr:hypothetical protein [Erwinia psidii]MCX8955969.1 hypothetical protein [Erwinia psidii]MCX8961341.1 hypothetical protein [Erwinia psidii]RQM38677.1 hypothetical protein EB241_08260 [Erwinia psidii]